MMLSVLHNVTVVMKSDHIRNQTVMKANIEIKCLKAIYYALFLSVL